MLRNVLIFHSGALGDFALSFPVALAITRLYPTSRVRYVCSSQKGRLAARMVGVEWVDVETATTPNSPTPQPPGNFSALFTPDLDPGEPVRKLLASSHRVISYLSHPDDTFSKRLRDLAPSATLTHLQTIPPTQPPSTPPTPPLHVLDHILRQSARTDLGGDAALSAAIEQILSLLRKQGLLRRVGADAGGRGVVIHPGSGSPSKCWPIDNFRELALRIKDHSHEDVRWVLGEVELERLPSDHRRALEALGDVVVPGDLLGLLEELLSARVFLGNDSGPGHVAALAGVPTVSLFGPTDPAIWSPLGPRVLPLRAPSHRLEDLTLDQVHTALQQA